MRDWFADFALARKQGATGATGATPSCEARVSAGRRSSVTVAPASRSAATGATPLWHDRCEPAVAPVAPYAERCATVRAATGMAEYSQSIRAVALVAPVAPQFQCWSYEIDW